MPTPRNKRRLIWLTGTVLILGGVGFISTKAFGHAPVKIESEKLATVERGDLVRSVVATGKIQPVTQVEIKSKASGIILKLPVNFGDTVRKGQVICELDKNDLIPSLEAERAALHVSEANVRSAHADYERLKIDAEGPDVAFLKRDRERSIKLFSDGLIAQNVRDDADKNYQMALNKQQSAKVNLGVAQASIARAEAQLEQQKAVVNRFEENLRNATIVSPVNGVVLSRDREVGDAVSSILTMGSGATLIMTLGELSEVYVKGKVDESDIGRVYLGQAARITVESFKDQKFQGKVTKISPMGAEKDNVTTFEVRVSISNETGKLRALMTANAEIILEEKKSVLTVPEGAILYAKDKSTQVEVPDAADKKGKKKVAVATGISNGSKTEILRGLTAGQQVVLQ
jgi:HlyD family secretion protein